MWEERGRTREHAYHNIDHNNATPVCSLACVHSHISENVMSSAVLMR